MFKDDTVSVGVPGGAAKANAHEERDALSGSAIFNMKCLIGRMVFPVSILIKITKIERNI
jgi:heat shock 70kDa protein 4